MEPGSRQCAKLCVNNDVTAVHDLQERLCSSLRRALAQARPCTLSAFVPLSQDHSEGRTPGHALVLVLVLARRLRSHLRMAAAAARKFCSGNWVR